MKGLCIGAMTAVWLMLAGTAWGGPRLVWDPNPAEEDVSGYTVFWGAVSRHDPQFRGYDDAEDTAGTSLELPLPEYGDHTFFAAVVARNAMGLTSDYSEEVTIDVGNPVAAAAGGGGGGGCFLQSLSPTGFTDRRP